jgi:polyhydroxybutyrate depolymerase
MSVRRAMMIILICTLAGGCAYTWGVEHVPLIGGPGPRSGWMHVTGGLAVYDVDVHIPKQLTAAVPLLIVLHGYSGTGPGMEKRTGFSRIADSVGFVVAYPDGQKNAQGRRSWTGSSDHAADIAMLRALIDSVAGRVPLDRQRVYLAGFSNGGMMTYRAAQLLDRTFAAIGVVAGALPKQRTERDPRRFRSSPCTACSMTTCRTTAMAAP